MEQKYGTRLFFRGARRLELTDAGMILYQQAKRMCEIEQAAKRQDQEKPEAAAKPRTPEQIYLEEMEISLGERLGRKVRVQQGRKKGTLVLEYYGKEDLQALCRLLAGE